MRLHCPPGHEPLPDGEFYGIPVDAGTVAFADVVGVETGMPSGNWYDDLFDPPTGDGWFNRMDDPSHYRAGVANIPIPNASNGENVVLSHSGWGDGFYPVVTTFDEAECLLAVHIDLMVVAPEE